MKDKDRGSVPPPPGGEMAGLVDCSVKFPVDAFGQFHFGHGDDFAE